VATDATGSPRACPWCGGPAHELLRASDRNRETTDERFAYARCTRCRAVFLEQVPGDLARYYASDYHGFDAHGQPDWKANPLLIDAEAFRIGLLERHIRPGRLVEIGAGAGGFAVAAKRAGFDVTAIEMDATCCEYLRSDVGVTAICTDEPVTALAGLGACRAVAMWHVLEHMTEPAAVVAAAAAKLEPGGLLALGVPNPAALQFRLLGSRWAHLDAPRHVSLIPAAALVARADDLGLRCVELLADDPFGRHCNMFGWAYALRRRPAHGPTPGPVVGAAQLMARLMGPIERRPALGAAITLVLRKDG
jgi:2-polyprenyl-3-methyl-5-hydroxy-6-metoxy-1,4-benzoquinol methylase